MNASPLVLLLLATSGDSTDLICGKGLPEKLWHRKWREPDYQFLEARLLGASLMFFN